MSPIAEVYLIPSDRTVLGPGSFGSCPPVRTRTFHGTWYDNPGSPETQALVLGHLGEVLPLGCFSVSGSPEPGIEAWVRAILDNTMDRTDWDLFTELYGSLGEFVFLDEDLNEVAP